MSDTVPKDQIWDFDDEELPQWARRQLVDLDSPWQAVPAPTPPGMLPVIARMFLWRLIFAVAFFLNLPIGCVSAGTSKAYELWLGMALFCLFAGIGLFSLSLIARVLNALATPSPFNTPFFSITAFNSLVTVPAFGALFMPVALVNAHLLSDRYVGVLILLSACVLFHYKFGSEILTFAQEKISVASSIGGEPTRTVTTNLKPSLLRLLIVLLIVLLIPTFYSVTLGIGCVVAFLFISLLQQFVTLKRRGPRLLVLAALLRRARTTALDYCDYLATEPFHWKPARGPTARWIICLLLTLSIDIVFIVGLDCFFPWELSAALTLPGYQFPESIFTHYSTTDFQWITTPLQLGLDAQARGPYIRLAIVALPIFFVATPATLLTTYCDALIELEGYSRDVNRSYL